MAAKIVRQPNSIALLGAPTSAAATLPGRETAPQSLRAAGIADRLQAIGYKVNDLGDDPLQLYQPDEQNPRTRNLSRVVAALEALKPRVEMAVKSGALPLILSGDSSIALATVAGVRRYFRNVGMIYMDRDACLQTPATTTTGSLDEMVVSHLAGRGAAELVRFWGEPPLVREPDLALFGTERTEQSEVEILERSPLRRYPAADVQRKGVSATAELAIERIHANAHEFVLHVDVDVIADFQATDRPGSSGLGLQEVREALSVFAKQKHLAAIEICGYNPTKDRDGSGVKVILDLLSEILEGRLEALKTAAPESPVSPKAAAAVSAPPDSETAIKESVPAATPGEAWSSSPDEDSDDTGKSETEDIEPPEQPHS